jgi:hypothetical protein
MERYKELKSRICAIKDMCCDGTITEFARVLNSNTNFARNLLYRQSDIYLDTFNLIVESFPLINPEWLRTGNGEMFKDDIPPRQVTIVDDEGIDEEPTLTSQENQVTTEDLLEIIKNKDARIEQALNQNTELISELRLQNKRITDLRTVVVNNLLQNNCTQDESSSKSNDNQ